MRIHYNVTGDQRKTMVKVIADTTGAKAEYKFMPTCAYEIDCFTVTKDGVLECSDDANPEVIETVMKALEAAGFKGIREAQKDQEANTEPQESEEDDSVELTVTLPMARHTGTSLRNLINLIYTRSGLLNKALGTAFRVDDGLVNVLQNDACVLTIDRLFETVEAYENHYGKAANGLCVEPERLTFSTLPETDDPAVMKTFTTLCAMMNKQAIAQQRIQAKAVATDNEKYAMRVWLLRLGMNGPEYKEERRILMEKLSGHAAFRTEDDRLRWQEKQNGKRDALKAAKQAGTEVEVTTDEVSE